jgi:UDP-N-acetylmuramoylalanine--D-glutamate ligase
VGGGKDSVVTLELLKRLQGTASGAGETECFLLSARQASYDTAIIAGYGPERQVEAFRVFDPQLLRMNREGYLNGHVPYSAILGFTAVVAALLRGRRHIILSNEGSANEPTVPGTWVNHQYSKSLEYETDFSEYIHRFLTPSVTYFSLLRPWSEARIAMEFACYPAYHKAFRSCNKGSRENRWCCDCPKCLFVFILIAAHAGVAATSAMFGENLLEKESLSSTLDELAGFTPVKPFECVGTVAETLWSFEKILSDPALPPDAARWPLADHFRMRRPAGGLPAFRLIEPELSLRVPPLFLPLVVSAMELLRDRLLPHQIGILGFGMEGRSTLAFLRQLFPERVIWIADRDAEKLGALAEEIGAGRVRAVSGVDYAEGLAGCSLVFKTPGLPWKEVDHLFQAEQITSQADLFLSVLKERTIGVTGTKGKSTTAYLICAALRACGRNCVMVGNMGLPALDALSSDTPDRVYVYELSSHMLETVRHAPHGAVFLNLYEEHLDHYRSFEAYAAAKGNMLRLQQAGDYAVIGNPVPAPLAGLGAGSHCTLDIGSDGTLILPSPAIGGRQIRIPESRFAGRALRGVHNLRNMQAALLAVHLYSFADPAPSCAADDPLCRGVNSESWIDAAIAAMNDFTGLPHRLQLVAVVKGISFFDDSISTIPQACIAAVVTIGDVDTLIFGGMDRGIDYTILSDFLSGGAVMNLVALPATGHRIVDLLSETGKLPDSARAFKARDMEEAVSIAFQVTRPGHSCLLSPAAASYGYYRNFEERGAHFSCLVKDRISVNVQI